ncbi:glucose 1-dehydrogenase [Desulfonatronum thioautotrophicum]|uniref:glucose 1-dehydrogenase n=1 Tax=Desulfonatronum thioautotrophicum TaxID=617001 RepID=UPI0005EB3F69|nr:glucose 1-dehydrogenase [Desulfonatronum thioautotrophicum]
MQQSFPQPSFTLAGQTAIVTGGSSGIGAGIAHVLAAAGANVAVNYSRNSAGADKVVRQISEQGCRAVAIQADVSSEQDVARMFDQTVRRFGTVDILVSNAGLQQDATLAEMTLEQWNRVIGINLTGAFLCARAATREFRRRGMVIERSAALGKIIFISSVHETIPWAGHANYAASKGGLMLLMKSIAQELGPQGIRVNSVAPGAVKTPINRAAWETPEAEADLLRLIPRRRVGETADIAKAVLWLASDDSDYVHGTSLVVDGGMTLYPGFATGG